MQREQDIFPNFQILEDQMIVKDDDDKDVRKPKRKLSLSRRNNDAQQLVTAGWYARTEALRVFNMRLRNKKLPESMSNKEFNRYVNN